MDATAVRADFDRIACLSKHRASPSREESRLLSRVPEGSRHVLDVGSGLGVVARALSRRAETVVAIDFSREMVRRARAAVAEYPNVEVREADFMACDLPARSFDAIVSFATLHHLPFEAALERAAPPRRRAPRARSLRRERLRGAALQRRELPRAPSQPGARSHRRARAPRRVAGARAPRSLHAPRRDPPTRRGDAAGRARLAAPRMALRARMEELGGYFSAFASAGALDLRLASSSL
jgi:SAM-dependent methyltransferase